MPTLAGLTAHIDLAQVMLYVFWLFLAGLIFYLRREDRREGYPLVSEVTGKAENHGAIWIPGPKTFVLPHGGVQTAPRERAEPPVRATPIAPWPGAPLQPTGNPLVDGVGPAAYALRSDLPDLTIEGAPRIGPLRLTPIFSLPEKGPDPRGMTVVAADGRVAGVIRDLWVDRSETLVRYYEIELSGLPQPRSVLLPTGFADVDGRKRRVVVNSILARQFADVPATKSPDQVSLREEDRISAYYGGGHLYATPSRVEPLL